MTKLSYFKSLLNVTIILASFIFQIKSELVQRTPLEEYQSMQTKSEIDKDTKIFVADKNGNIGEKPYLFNPNNWTMDISLIDTKNGKNCIALLKYFLDEKKIFVIPKNPNRKKLGLGDLIIYFQKGENSFQLATLPLISNNKTVEITKCPVGVYKGVKKIDPITDKLEEINLITDYLHKSFIFINLIFNEIRFQDFDLVNFQKIVDFSKSPTKNQIISFLEETKKSPLIEINNDNFINHFKENASTKLIDLEKENSLFCTKFEETQGKILI